MAFVGWMYSKHHHLPQSDYAHHTELGADSTKVAFASLKTYKLGQ